MSRPFYESSRQVNEYLLFHYGADDEILPFPFGPTEALHFAARAVTETFDLHVPIPRGRALDLGCAVGGSSFVLSRFASEVVGIDASKAFIAAAAELAHRGSLSYERLEEGRVATPLVARVPEGARPERVRFATGDAMDLPAELGSFDWVLAANLICRLPHPEALLARLPALVVPDGQLVITSPYTWMEAFTEPGAWLGGFSAGGAPVFTLERLQARLEGAFSLEAVSDLPFLIREHARKFQWSVAQATRWRRKA